MNAGLAEGPSEDWHRKRATVLNSAAVEGYDLIV